MSTDWSRDRVLQLAPDPSSAKSGQELANPRKWVSVVGDEGSIWGLCQGSGKKPYQTIVDLGEPAFKCSCPSRKFPCKHGLGLLLQFASGPENFARAERPDWVNEWMASRAERAQKKAEKAEAPPRPVDAEAQAARRAKRLQRVAAGMGSLRTWVDDIVHDGIAGVQTRGYSFFDETARRMIDAQAPGVARMIQELGETVTVGGKWHEPFLRRLCALHLLIEAHSRLDQLPPETREDVLATLGLPSAQEEVLALPPARDVWQIIAQEVEFEEKLRVQKTWLSGVESRRPALILHFAFGTAPLDASFVVGTQFDGELCFFPGSGIRAAVKSRQASKLVERFTGHETLDAALDAYSQIMARQPWVGFVALPLRSVMPLGGDRTWQIVDTAGGSLPAIFPPAADWQTVALSGGRSIDLVASFDGQKLRPLTAMAEREILSFGNASGSENVNAEIAAA